MRSLPVETVSISRVDLSERIGILAIPPDRTG
jgi:hypothetical protein